MLIFSHYSAAGLFHKPVDFTQPGCEEYYQIIENPTDLQTMITKNNRGEYGSVAAFEEEFTRMIENCLFYNYVCIHYSILIILLFAWL